jgi:glycosyltransferase involved in cell wall biosynthesis
MRILIINQYFPPDASNTAYLLGELAEDLAARHEVTVVAGRPSYNTGVSSFVPRGPRVVRIRSTGFDRSSLWGRAANYLSYLAGSMVRAMALPRPDVVVTMTDPPVIGVIGAAVSMRYRRPLVHVCHDLYPDIAIALGTLQPGRATRIWGRVNRFVWSRADLVCAVSRDMQDKLVARGVPARRVEVVPTWATAQAPDPEGVARTRSELGWDGRMVVMHAGNLGLAQDAITIVRAAQHLRERSDIEIVFLGDGAGKSALVEIVRSAGLDNVSFLSHRPKPEAQRLMEAADLHVVSLVPGLSGCAAPSKTYGIMAAGRPYVAAVDAGTEPQLIAAEYGCGAHVPPGDPEALAGAILRLRDEDLDAMGARGRAALEHGYSRATVVRRFERLVQDVAAGRFRRSLATAGGVSDLPPPVS